MKKLVCILLAMLMLLTMVGCKKDEETADDGTLYVMTQAAYYDEDGICWKRFDYTYDDAGQMLKMDVYLIEMSDIYYPEWDVYVEGYTKDSPLNLYGTVQLEYDKKGNLATCDDYKYLFYGQNGSYEWDYRDGKPESYTFTYKLSDFSLSPTCLEYDKAGNITRTYCVQEGQERDSALFAYDKYGRLTREITCTLDGTVCEKTYAYENGHLSSVQLRTGLCYYGDGSDHWDDDLYVRYTWEFKYDGKLLTKMNTYNGDGDKVEVRNFSYDKSGHPTETKTIVYTDDGKETTTETYTTDAMGNILKVTYEDGSWVEYTYEARKVTAKQAANYRRRQGFDNRSYEVDSVNFTVYRDFASCNLLPNPLFDLPYFLQLLGD